MAPVWHARVHARTRENLWRLISARKVDLMKLSRVVLLCFVIAVIHSEVVAQVSSPSSVPAGLTPDLAANLERQRQSLLGQLDHLNSHMAANSASCSHIAVNDVSQNAFCDRDTPLVRQEYNAYLAALNAYERAIKGAGRTGRWSQGEWVPEFATANVRGPCLQTWACRARETLIRSADSALRVTPKANTSGMCSISPDKPEECGVCNSAPPAEACRICVEPSACSNASLGSRTREALGCCN